MNEIYDSYQEFMLIAAGIAFALTGTAMAVALAGPVVTAAVRRLSRGARAALVLFAVVLTIYGGSKFRFGDGIRNNGSYATNDTVHISWIADDIHYVPLSADIYIDYRRKGSTNSWDRLGQSVVYSWNFDAHVDNATSYEYQVWANYVPPSPVHTNGVWSYSTIRNGKLIIPVRATVEGDGKTLNMKGAK